ncbi:MerR family transcriptional regulator [Streptomyces sp. NPDC048253]|uniref:MerR family transcriptional regulator n=1 Tax=Streptomyces sp. NPDC048253 TaxID=3365524 RepID=UPI003721E8D0
MRIGELEKLTNTPARSLRYYEQQGLITPQRLDNGYREYDDYLVDRVLQIRGLIDSGIPTRIIKQMLPCLGKPRTIVVEDADPELLAVLARERDKMNRRIDCLIRNRDAIDGYMQAVAQASPAQAGASARH